MALRLRLEFAPTLVTEGMASQQLQKCWHEPLPTSLSIGDLASELVTRFALADVGSPSDLQLSCGGFTLPQSSQLSLLRDGDLVAVSLVAKAPSHPGHSGMQHTACHGGMSEGGSARAENSAGASRDPGLGLHASPQPEGWIRDGSAALATSPVVNTGANAWVQPIPPAPGASTGPGLSRLGGMAVGGAGAGTAAGQRDMGDVAGVSSGELQDPSAKCSKRARAGGSYPPRTRNSDVNKPCLVCRDVLGKHVLVRMHMMREHVAEHILSKDIDSAACGFCGQVGSCNSSMEKGAIKGTVVPVSNCTYFHKFSTKMLQKNPSRCTNMPLVCSACVPPKTFWKYHMRDHWAACHKEQLQAGKMPAEFLLSDVEVAHLQGVRQKLLKRKVFQSSAQRLNGASGASALDRGQEGNGGGADAGSSDQGDEDGDGSEAGGGEDAGVVGRRQLGSVAGTRREAQQARASEEGGGAAAGRAMHKTWQGQHAASAGAVLAVGRSGSSSAEGVASRFHLDREGSASHETRERAGQPVPFLQGWAGSTWLAQPGVAAAAACRVASGGGSAAVARDNGTEASSPGERASRPSAGAAGAPSDLKRVLGSRAAAAAAAAAAALGLPAAHSVAAAGASAAACIALVAPGSSPSKPAAVVDPVAWEVAAKRPRDSTTMTAQGQPDSQQQRQQQQPLQAQQQQQTSSLVAGLQPVGRSNAGSPGLSLRLVVTRPYALDHATTPAAVPALASRLYGDHSSSSGGGVSLALMRRSGSMGGGGGSAGVGSAGGGSTGGVGSMMRSGGSAGGGPLPLHFLPTSQSLSRLLDDPMGLSLYEQMQLMQQAQATSSSEMGGAAPAHAATPLHAANLWYHPCQQHLECINDQGMDAGEQDAVAMATAAAAAAAAAAEVPGGSGEEQQHDVLDDQLARVLDVEMAEEGHGHGQHQWGAAAAGAGRCMGGMGGGEAHDGMPQQHPQQHQHLLQQQHQHQQQQQQQQQQHHSHQQQQHLGQGDGSPALGMPSPMFVYMGRGRTMSSPFGGVPAGLVYPGDMHHGLSQQSYAQAAAMHHASSLPLPELSPGHFTSAVQAAAAAQQPQQHPGVRSLSQQQLMRHHHLGGYDFFGVGSSEGLAMQHVPTTGQQMGSAALPTSPLMQQGSRLSLSTMGSGGTSACPGTHFKGPTTTTGHQVVPISHTRSGSGVGTTPSRGGSLSLLPASLSNSEKDAAAAAAAAGAAAAAAAAAIAAMDGSHGSH